MSTRFQLEKNAWVKIMLPHAKRLHCLAVIDGGFAHTHCGKGFRLNELIGVTDHDTGQRCPSCADRLALASRKTAPAQ